MSETEMKSAVDEAANVLIDKDLSIAFAESATAGRAAAEFSIACKAGKFLKGGLVCYDNTGETCGYNVHSCAAAWREAF